MLDIPRHADAGGKLHALRRLAERAGAERVAADAGELAERLEEGRFHLVCVGQFKRGKSTLLNALVGEPVLPVGVAPVTSAVTVLRHAPEKRARVRFADRRGEEIAPSDVATYVSEPQNPGNRKGVRVVEVFLPSPLLEPGMSLVDTPGLGSVFAANAAVTREFMPHVDAALVVIGADPPISGEELALVEEVAKHVDHLLFVLNKADRLSEEECAEATRFSEEVLARRLGRRIGPVYLVSALERIERGRPTRHWNALVAAIEALAHETAGDLLAAAEKRGVARAGHALLRELGERRDALVRPIEESERRVESLRRYVASCRRALGDLGVLLSAEQARLSTEFRHRQEAYLPGAQERARAELDQALRRIPRRSSIRIEGFRAAQEIMHRMLEVFHANLEPVAEEMYQGVMARFVEHANEFLERLARSGESGSENLPTSLGPESGFRAPSRAYRTELLSRTWTPLRSLVDRFRPRESVLRSALRQVGSYLDDIVEFNSSRVANDLVERVAVSRASLERDLQRSLEQVSVVADRALALAKALRARGRGAVAGELERLEAAGREVEEVLSPNSEGEGT